MGDLSNNFSRSEFACKHCKEVIVNPSLVDGLQKLRDKTGRSITILSGYRCPQHNINVGGAKLSQHPQGTAADITIAGLNEVEMVLVAEQIPEFRTGGIGFYPGRLFAHVDVRGSRARWAQVKGKYTSIAKALAS